MKPLALAELARLDRALIRKAMDSWRGITLDHARITVKKSKEEL